MRLIDADEAYKVLTEYYHHKEQIQHDALKEAIDRVPTITPLHSRDWNGWETGSGTTLRPRPPVRTARWIDHEGYTTCSFCAANSWVQSYYRKGFRADYCPECGAKMEEEK